MKSRTKEKFEEMKNRSFEMFEELTSTLEEEVESPIFTMRPINMEETLHDVEKPVEFIAVFENKMMMFVEVLFTPMKGRMSCRIKAREL